MSVKDPCSHWAALPAMYPDGPPPNLDRCPWCGVSWPERKLVAESPKRRWRPGINRTIEEALREAEPAAEWLRTHPPGARLPEALEPGYEPEEYEPESNGVEG